MLFGDLRAVALPDLVHGQAEIVLLAQIKSGILQRIRSQRFFQPVGADGQLPVFYHFMQVVHQHRLQDPEDTQCCSGEQQKRSDQTAPHTGDRQFLPQRFPFILPHQNDTRPPSA